MKLAVPIQAPLKSKTYLAVLRLVRSENGDADALRELLWRIGAQQFLIAHGRLFENVFTLLAASPLHAANLAWASNWRYSIERWRQLLQFLVHNKEKLAAIAELEPLYTEPTSARDHPLLGTHIDRHPVAAALWNRHHSAEKYPPAEDNSTGVNYFHLQAHLLCAYFEAREHANNGLAEFEQYIGKREFAPIPIGAGPVGRTVREFSLPAYDDVMRQLPRHESTKDFAKALVDVPLDLRNVPGTSRTRAQQYFENLVVYFVHFYNLLGLEKIDPRRGGSGPTKTDGANEARPGFVHFTGGILSIEDTEDTDDESLPKGAYQSVKQSLRSGDEDTTEELERSGLAPQERDEELLNLYSPEAIAQKLSQVKYKRQAMEMAAHRFWWDRSNVTPLQLHSFWRLAESAIGAWDTAERPPTELKNCACGALLLKGMLVLGQNRERIRQLRFEVLQPPFSDSLESLCLLARENLSLVVSTPDATNLAESRPLGFLIPEIQPQYHKSLPDEILQLGRAHQARLALPDLTNFGTQLTRWMNREDRERNKDGTVLGIRPDTADASIQAFFKFYDTTLGAGQRLIEANFPRWLAITAETLTGDQSLAWILTGNLDRRNETRMHYTQHMTARLLDVYLHAMRRLRSNLRLQLKRNNEFPRPSN